MDMNRERERIWEITDINWHQLTRYGPFWIANSLQAFPLDWSNVRTHPTHPSGQVVYTINGIHPYKLLVKASGLTLLGLMSGWVHGRWVKGNQWEPMGTIWDINLIDSDWPVLSDILSMRSMHRCAAFSRQSCIALDSVCASQATITPVQIRMSRADLNFRFGEDVGPSHCFFLLGDRKVWVWALPTFFALIIKYSVYILDNSCPSFSWRVRALTGTLHIFSRILEATATF